MEKIISHYSNGNIKEIRCMKGTISNGEYKWFTKDGFLKMHCYFKDNVRNGELKYYNSDKELEIHSIYMYGFDMTSEILKTLKIDNLSKLTPEDKIFINLKFGVPCLK